MICEYLYLEDRFRYLGDNFTYNMQIQRSPGLMLTMILLIEE